MARKSAVLVSVDLPLDSAQIEAIVGSVPGDGTQSSKVASVALGLIEQLVEGGVMLSKVTVRKLEEAAGKAVDEAALIETFEAGMGKQGGARVVMIPIDPVHEPALMEVARSNGFPSAEALMRRDIEDLWDQGHFYMAVPQPRRVLMSDNDYAELRALLGKDFDNGTELAGAVKQHVAENAGLFPVGERGVTRRNWFVSLLAPFVAKLSNVGRGKRAPKSPDPVGQGLSNEFTVCLKDPDDTCTYWKRDGAKVLRSIPEGFVAFADDGRPVHVGDRFTSVRLEPVVAEVEVRMTKDIHVPNPRNCYKLNTTDGTF